MPTALDPAILRVADRMLPSARTAFLAAAHAAAGAIDLGALASAVRSGKLSAVEAAAQLEYFGAEARRRLLPVLGRTWAFGFEAAAGGLGVSAEAVFGLDLVNAEAVEWARYHGAELVTEVLATTRAGIRVLVEAATRGEMDVRRLARELREVVGLHSRQVSAVERFRASLEAAGVPLAQVDARVAKYAAAQLRRRATTIARTEVIAASAEGQERLWAKAAARGLIDPKTVRRVWVVTHDDRLDVKICEPLDGAEAALGRPFHPGGFTRPPAHPNCRCAVVLKRGAPSRRPPAALAELSRVSAEQAAEAYAASTWSISDSARSAGLRSVEDIVSGPWSAAGDALQVSFDVTGGKDASDPGARAVVGRLYGVVRGLPASHARRLRVVLNYSDVRKSKYFKNVMAKFLPYEPGQPGILIFMQNASRSVESTLVHELGHSVAALGDFADTLAARTAERVSRYAATSAQEAFAEAYAMYASPHGRAVMAVRYPQTHALMQNLFEGDASAWGQAGRSLRPAGSLPELLPPERRRLAVRTYKPSTAVKQRLGEAEQARLTRAIGGVETGDNEPFDVLIGKHGIEVKTVMDNDNDKITVHPESRRRKEEAARREGLGMHTVAIDIRGGRRVYYYRDGVGAYRLGAMRRVTLAELREILGG